MAGARESPLLEIHWNPTLEKSKQQAECGAARFGIEWERYKTSVESLDL